MTRWECGRWGECKSARDPRSLALILPQAREAPSCLHVWAWCIWFNVMFVLVHEMAGKKNCCSALVVRVSLKEEK